MEQRETLDNEITTREGERKRLQDDVARLQSAIAAHEAEIDAEVATETAARAEAAARDPRRVAERLRAAPRAEPRGRRGAARRHDVPGVPPDDPVDRSGTHPPGRGQRSRVLRQLRRDPRPVNQLSFEPTSDDDRPAEVVVYCDGGSRGNPGPAAIGAVVLDPSTDPPTRVATVSARRIGITTNNVAEYQALIAGLEAAAPPAGASSSTCAPIRCSMIKQVAGEFRVRQPHLQAAARAREGVAPRRTTRSTCSTCGAS